MPLFKYEIKFKSNDNIIEEEASTLRELSEKTGISYDILQKKFSHGDKYNNSRIISVNKSIIQAIRRKKYVKTKQEITYKIVRTEEVEHVFTKLSDGAKLLNVSIPTLHRILKSEEQKNKYNITIA